MFTEEELNLIDAALTEYYLKHNEEYERQKAKGRTKCNWHLSVMNRTSNLQSKIYRFKNGALITILVDKIASFFETENNWTALKQCWLENECSEDLRKLLTKALNTNS